MKNISIQFIPHASQVYDTLGDYRAVPGLDSYYISSELSEDAQFLVMIHELIESYLCRRRGISWESIDNFDIQYEKSRNAGHEYARGMGRRITPDSEPGDDFMAPYYIEHQFASAVERLIAVELGVHWNLYEKHCIDVLNKVDHPDRHEGNK